MPTERTTTGDLARTVELLWGATAPRGTRGPRPQLSVEKITRAAIAVADAEGLVALSMQRVAAELGYTTMSLYNYVPGKDQLVELMMDAATPPPPRPEPGGSWQDDLERWVHATWELLLKHPWVLRAAAPNPPLGPNQLAWFESALSTLSRSGLAGDEVLSLTLFLLASIRGQAALAVDLARPGSGDPEFGEVLARVVTAERFPTLFGIVSQRTSEDRGERPSFLPDLEFGLHRLLDGVRSYVESRLAPS